MLPPLTAAMIVACEISNSSASVLIGFEELLLFLLLDEELEGVVVVFVLVV
jgi:hypothetical protein